MKKFLAILLAVSLIFCFAMTVMADDETAPTITPEGTISKTYDVTGGETYPVEELTFTVEADENNMDADGELVVGTNNAFTTTGDATMDIPLTFPTYSKVGVYKYTITEEPGSTLGVTYDDEPIVVIVSITYNPEEGAEDELVATVAIHKGDEEGEKDEGFTNVYGLGQLTVTKVVSGNLADKTKLFTIHVTFTSENATGSITYTVADGEEQTVELADEVKVDVELSDGQSAVFTNIPVGVSYTVEEDEQHIAQDGQDITTTEEGYTVTYEDAQSGDIAEAGEEDSVTVSNYKNVEPNTGISLDSLPYILIAVAVVAALVIMIVRKRRYQED